MASSRQFIEEIQAALAAPEPADLDHLASLAEQYVGACDRINQTTARCRELLDRGLHELAWQLLGEEDAYREELSLLDFPERPAWLDLCRQMVLPAPAALDVGTAKWILESRSARGARLAGLKRLYRRQSLGRAPLAVRLQTLRQIAGEDRISPTWQQDVRTFEAARVEELALLAEGARQAGELGTLEAILTELRTPGWLAAPAVKFIEGVEALASPLRKHHAATRYAALAGQIRDAREAEDPSRCAALLGEWAAVGERTGCGPADRLARDVEPVRAWLAEATAAHERQVAHEKACAELAGALDGREGRATLEGLSAAVGQTGKCMPAELDERFARRMKALRRAERRKFALIGAAVICGIALAAGGITFGWRANRRRQAIERWTERITARMDDDDLAGAEAMFEQLSADAPEILATPALRKLHTAFLSRRDQDRQRRQALSAAVTTLEQVGVASIHFADALAAAEALAASAGEKRILGQWRRKLEAHQRRQQAGRDDAFRLRLSALERTLAGLGRTSPLDEAFQGRAEACLADAKKLAADADGVSSALTARARSLLEQAGRHVTAAERTRRQQKAIAEAKRRMRGLADRPAELATALKAFAQAYPADPSSPAFGATAEVAPHWQAAQAWAAMVAGWGSTVPTTDSVGIRSRLTSLSAYLVSHRHGPHKADAAKVRGHLQAALAAWADGQLKGLDTLREILAYPLFTDVYRLTDTTGRAYYLKGPEVRWQTVNGKVVGARFHYIVDGSLTTQLATLTAEEIATRPAKAPQAVFAEAATAMLAAGGAAGWETLYLRLAELARKQDNMDPILKAFLVKFCLDTGAEIAPFEAEAIRQAAAGLARYDLTVGWVDPHDPTANGLRNRVAASLRRVPPLPPLIAKVSGQMGVPPAYRPVGVVLTGQESFPVAGASAGEGLYVIGIDRLGSPTYRKVGTVAAGKAIVDAAALTDLPIGGPVYVRVK